MISTTGSKYVVFYGRSFEAEFKFDPHDSDSRRAASERAHAYQQSKIRELSKKVGRPLTTRELASGLSHQEDRTTHERALDMAFKVTPIGGFEPDDPNPYRRRLAEIEANRPKSKEERYEQLAREWDAENDAKAAQEKADRDPQRIKARKHARALLDDLLYDHTIPKSLVVKAEQCVAQAEGCLATFKRMVTNLEDAIIAGRNNQAVEAAEVAQTAAQQADVMANEAASLHHNRFATPEPEPESKPPAE